MKPVVIFRHAKIEGAGYLGKFLTEKGIIWKSIKVDENEPLPPSAKAFSGIVFMGGPMSVNDPLPWIPHMLELIREAVSLDIPVLGHCLGGQLISKALGGVVGSNPVKEIGWGEVNVTKSPVAKQWFGDLDKFNSFHWHGETFTLPENATHLIASKHCQNQAYAIGKHLALQCHIEMTEELVNAWCENGVKEIAESSDSPGVLQVAEIQHDLKNRIAQLNSIAHTVYERWIQGLKP